MTVTLDSIGFDEVPHTYEAQFAEFQKLAKKHNCKCANMGQGSCYTPTYIGTPDNIRHLIVNEYCTVEEILDIYGLNSFEELDDNYEA